MRRRVRFPIKFVFYVKIILLGTLSLGNIDLWIRLPLGIAVFICLISYRQFIQYTSRVSLGSLLNKLPMRPHRTWKNSEKWLISLSFWIPRRFREAVVGDILEDCRDMRSCGYSERRIQIHVT